MLNGNPDPSQLFKWRKLMYLQNFFRLKWNQGFLLALEPIHSCRISLHHRMWHGPLYPQRTDHQGRQVLLLFLRISQTAQKFLQLRRLENLAQLSQISEPESLSHTLHTLTLPRPLTHHLPLQGPPSDGKHKVRGSSSNKHVIQITFTYAYHLKSHVIKMTISK